MLRSLTAGTRMHQTTVRFSPELWSMLELEASRSGVSVAHYVRDAALARLAFNAGQRSVEDAQPFEWADPRVADAERARAGSRAGADASSAAQMQARLAAPGDLSPQEPKGSRAAARRAAGRSPGSR